MKRAAIAPICRNIRKYAVKWLRPSRLAGRVDSVQPTWWGQMSDLPQGRLGTTGRDVVTGRERSGRRSSASIGGSSVESRFGGNRWSRREPIQHESARGELGRGQSAGCEFA